MLALKHGFKHWIVYLCQRYEFFLGQLADINICVSDTFAKNLRVHMIKLVIYCLIEINIYIFGFF
jgi:preprotein translocase subunit SecF